MAFPADRRPTAPPGRFVAVTGHLQTGRKEVKLREMLWAYDLSQRRFFFKLSQLRQHSPIPGLFAAFPARHAGTTRASWARVAIGAQSRADRRDAVLLLDSRQKPLNSSARIGIRSCILSAGTSQTDRTWRRAPGWTCVSPFHSRPRPKRRPKPSDVSGPRSLPGTAGDKEGAPRRGSPPHHPRRDRKRAYKWVSRSLS